MLDPSDEGPSRQPVLQQTRTKPPNKQKEIGAKIA